MEHGGARREICAILCIEFFVGAKVGLSKMNTDYKCVFIANHIHSYIHSYVQKGRQVETHPKQNQEETREERKRNKESTCKRTFRQGGE